MDYIVDDKLSAPVFLALAKNVWPGNYDAAKTQEALYRTLNITAYDGGLLVGCLRILTDGYYFGTITELLVLPEYQKRGIGSRLLELARKKLAYYALLRGAAGGRGFLRKEWM